MTLEPQSILACPQCGMQLAPTLKACPGCARLVHAEALAALANTAREAADRGDLTAALAAWREALDLLPIGSKQHHVIAAKITELGKALPSNTLSAEPASGGNRRAWGVASGVGALGLLAWKFKAILLGLTKGSTLLSMFLALGVYWTAWGWKFALGIVLSIYVHEMGHVIALRRYGFKASAPMFLPGLGAIVRLQQRVVNPREDAEIGLAGPIYGLVAAAVSLGLWVATDLPIFAAIGSVGAWINLFNLLPVASLDGGRAFHAMSREQKLLSGLVVAAAWLVARDGMLILLGLLCVARAFSDPPRPAAGAKAAWTYCLLIVSLTAAMLAGQQINVGNP
ncbi:MAG: site-2 protease family protein [Pirellulales bacterium]|nr:site-2 protease family protein [Pirellulales bacterium]